MKYRITVNEIIRDKNNEKFTSSNTIYEQTVENIKLEKLILVVNNLIKE